MVRIMTEGQVEQEQLHGPYHLRSVAPTVSRPQPFRFVSVRTFKNPVVFRSNWQWKDAISP